MPDTTSPIETQPERAPIDANALEAMARERPDEKFLKGSGVLKLIGAIRQLEGELRTLRMADPAAGISRELLGKIVDEAFGGSIEDTTPIEDIYRIVVREVPRRLTPNLENLQDRLLAPTPIERDDIGHWYHPHLPDCDEGVHYGDLLAVFGMEVACMDMEGDAPELYDHYSEAGDPDCSAWQPTPPEGEGWALLAIYDTEDGPYAMFARKAPEPRPPSLRTATERARKFEAAYYKEARRAVEFGDVIQNHVHAMQAAVIEANLGKGTATAMAWIVNTLRGPGHLPDLDAAAKLDDPQGEGKAQVWFDLVEAQHALFREAHPVPQPPKGGA